MRTNGEDSEITTGEPCQVRKIKNVNVTKRMVTNVTFSALSSGRKRPFVKHLNVTCSDKNSRHYVHVYQ